jgi:hypothetical protein
MRSVYWRKHQRRDDGQNAKKQDENHLRLEGS